MCFPFGLLFQISAFGLIKATPCEDTRHTVRALATRLVPVIQNNPERSGRGTVSPLLDSHLGTRHLLLSRQTPCSLPPPFPLLSQGGEH